LQITKRQLLADIVNNLALDAGSQSNGVQLLPTELQYPAVRLVLLPAQVEALTILERRATLVAQNSRRFDSLSNS
jgi:hypothetical protein